MNQASLHIRQTGDLRRLSFSAMASPCEILLECAASDAIDLALQQAADETWRIERKFSRYRDDNIIHDINHAQGQTIRVDEETARLLDFAQQCWTLSRGAFDITSGILRRVWHFDGSDQLPNADDIQALLPLIGWDKVKWAAPELRLASGMEIDLGGIGKEYAVDRVLEQLNAQLKVPILVNFGGDLRCNGPRRNGSAWRVGVDVDATGQVNQGLALQFGALATSGDATRYLCKDGIRYSHVLDARTGWPVQHAPVSVTVAAPSCSQAGILSTLALLQGAEAEAFLQAQEVDYWLSWEHAQ